MANCSAGNCNCECGGEKGCGCIASSDFPDDCQCHCYGAVIGGGLTLGLNAFVALWPERVRGLVSGNSYNIQDIPNSGAPASAAAPDRGADHRLAGRGRRCAPAASVRAPRQVLRRTV
jgi:hypothetical protein